jgi:hypothetical protein
MRMPIFSIGRLLAVIGVLGIAFAALRSPSYLWANATFTAAQPRSQCCHSGRGVSGRPLDRVELPRPLDRCRLPNRLDRARQL